MPVYKTFSTDDGVGGEADIMHHAKQLLSTKIGMQKDPKKLNKIHSVRESKKYPLALLFICKRIEVNFFITI